jgi:hypothetical protein
VAAYPGVRAIVDAHCGADDVEAGVAERNQ